MPSGRQVEKLYHGGRTRHPASSLENTGQGPQQVSPLFASSQTHSFGYIARGEGYERGAVLAVDRPESVVSDFAITLEP